MKTLSCCGSLMLGLWILMIFCTPCKVLAQEFAVITHKNIEESLDRDEIKHIFLGQKTRWGNDLGVTFALPADKTLCNTFLRAYLGKSYTQYLNYWKKQVFTGKGRMPVFFRDEQELLTFVAQTPGAISFVAFQHVNKAQVNIMPITQKKGR